MFWERSQPDFERDLAWDQQSASCHPTPHSLEDGDSDRPLCFLPSVLSLFGRAESLLKVMMVSVFACVGWLPLALYLL